MAGDLDFSSVQVGEVCGQCGETIPRHSIPRPRMQKAAWAILISCIPINLVWFAVVTELLWLGWLVPRTYRDIIALPLLSFIPTILLARFAWGMRRVFTVRCRKCGWSETRFASMRTGRPAT